MDEVATAAMVPSGRLQGCMGQESEGGHGPRAEKAAMPRGSRGAQQ